MFVSEPPHSTAVDSVYVEERADTGYVMNNTRLWCYRPDVSDGFVELRSLLTQSSTLSPRELAVLVVAQAAARADSYCALAWGARLAGMAGDDAAAAVVAGRAEVSLTERETALAAWARVVVTDPNATTAQDVDVLRRVGLTDVEIFEATAFVALRMAFSTVDNALGAEPDRQLADTAPTAVRDVVSFGRPPARAAS